MFIKSTLIHNIISPQEGKPFYTHGFSSLIYSLIYTGKHKSYLELGCGFGMPMLLAGIALRDVNVDDYILVGLDKRDNRIDRARELLNKNGIKYTIYKKDVKLWKPTDVFDTCFIDCGWNINQLLIDRYSPYVRKCFILHDVNSELVFPEGFVSFYLPGNFAIAYKKDPSVIKKYDTSRRKKNRSNNMDTWPKWCR